MKPILSNSRGKSGRSAGHLIRALPVAAFAAIAILAAVVAIASSKTSSEQEIKARYDGQDYRSERGSYNGSSYKGLADMETDYIAMPNPVENAVSAESDMASPDLSVPRPESPGNTQAPAHGRKLTYTYEYETETTDFDGSLEALDDALESAGGYMESSCVDRMEHDRIGGGKRVTVRRGTYTLRVPSDRIDDLVSAFLSEQSQIVYENVRMSDKTAAYIDAETQAESYRAEYLRLEALLQQAGNVTETIEIQDRLSDLNYQIQCAEKQMDLIDEDVLYATVDLTVYEVVYYTADVSSYRYGFGMAMADAAEEFLYGIPTFLFAMVYIFAGGLVIVGLGAIMAAVVVRVVNKRQKDRVVRIVDGRPGTEGRDA